MNSIPQVTATTAQTMLKNGALMVDVREPSEIAQKAYDVPNVLCIPLGELRDRFQEIPADRELILACRSGNRSEMAIHFLLTHGYKQALNLQYGIMGWENDGFPVVKQVGAATRSWFM